MQIIAEKKETQQQGYDLSTIQSAFVSNLPLRPRCTSGHGQTYRTRPLPRDYAVYGNSRNGPSRHIQPNEPWLHRLIVLDIDRPDSMNVLEDSGLPSPAVAIRNPDNGHAHAAWLLADPVRSIQYGGRWGPVCKLERLMRGMTTEAKADFGYHGGLMKNPLCREYETYFYNDYPYPLTELEDYIDIEKYNLGIDKSVEKQALTYLGRNCDTFDAIRSWAYSAVCNRKRAGVSLDSWISECTEKANSYTQSEHDTPLLFSEVRSIGKSIAKWTWKHFSVEYIESLKRERSRRSNLKRWGPPDERNKQILALHNKGLSNRQIAKKLGISHVTVAKVIKGGHSYIS